MKIFKKLKIIAVVVLIIAAFIGINVWLAAEDRRMLTEYMTNCAKMKTEGTLKPNVDCYEEFVNAYRASFRRNP